MIKNLLRGLPLRVGVRLFAVARKAHGDGVKHARPVSLLPPGPVRLFLVVGLEPREVLGGDDLGRGEAGGPTLRADEFSGGCGQDESDEQPLPPTQGCDGFNQLLDMRASLTLGKERALDGKDVGLAAPGPARQDAFGFLRDVCRAHPGLPDILHVGADQIGPDEERDAHVATAGINGQDPGRPCVCAGGLGPSMIFSVCFPHKYR